MAGLPDIVERPFEAHRMLFLKTRAIRSTRTFLKNVCDTVYAGILKNTRDTLRRQIKNVAPMNGNDRNPSKKEKGLQNGARSVIIKTEGNSSLLFHSLLSL